MLRETWCRAGETFRDRGTAVDAGQIVEARVSSIPGNGIPGGEGADESEESRAARLTRNYNELLQELRVVQTGVQILTGFLLTLPFTARFATLDEVQRRSYLAVLVGSVAATAFIIAPVAFHRTLFQRGQRPWLVRAANHSARMGLMLLSLTTTGMLWLVFDVVVGRVEAVLAGGLALCFFVLLWLVVPLASRGRAPADPASPHA
jgi:Family of unknown function (DUF6328)